MHNYGILVVVVINISQPTVVVQSQLFVACGLLHVLWYVVGEV